MYAAGKVLCFRDWRDLCSDFRLFFRSLRNVPVSEFAGEGSGGGGSGGMVVVFSLRGGIDQCWRWGGRRSIRRHDWQMYAIAGAWGGIR